MRPPLTGFLQSCASEVVCGRAFYRNQQNEKQQHKSVLFVSFISLCCAELRKIKKLYLGGPCVVGEGYDDS